MSLTAGTRLGPYEITGPLGAGGMGEVYRGRDTRLDRSVAIKVLPEHLAATPDLRARLEREARTISSLNHPHICTLHDVGHQDGVDFLVMELVDGETLAERLTRGALPTDLTLRTGIEIADALDRAHRSGIVHRDLKPGNIMLTKSGAKLMDFGLARGTIGPAGGPDAQSQSPTMTTPLTAEGRIVGTFQYMSPEQLEGREADARSDLFALGAVLYEMITGRRAFEGKSQASLIGSIMNTEPPSIASVAPLSPPGLERVVRACLAKEPDERIQTAHDVNLQLQWIRDAGSQAGVAVPVAERRKNRERLAWVLAAMATVVAAAALVIPRLGPRPGPPRVMRFEVAGPAGATLVTDAPEIAISPDGHQIAILATDSSGTGYLWVRPLESLEARRIDGTDNAFFPFWSPDGRSLAFFADGKLKKLALSGGLPEVLCDAPDGRGGSWGKNGVIVFAPMASGPIVRVSADGGDVTMLYSPDSTRKETGLRWPEFLPDGRHFTIVSLPSSQGNYDIDIGSVDAKPRRRLTTSSASPVYATPGHLLFVRNARLMAQRFDLGGMKLEGEPRTLGEAPPLSGSAGARAVSVSATGIIAHPAAGLPNTRVEWMDRTGRVTGTVPLPPGRWEGLGVSPDGQWLVVERRSSATEKDLWMVELARGLATRFTLNSASIVTSATWSPDGEWVAFNSSHLGPVDIYRKRAGGGGDEEPLLESSTLFKNLSQWTPDGGSVIFSQPDPQTGWDVWRLPVDGDRKPLPLVRTRFNEYGGFISPDGHWLSFVSDESGKLEVYVQAYPQPGRKYQVSTAGGSGGLWSRDGKEMLFGGLDGTAMLVAVETTPTFKAGVPRVLFKGRPDAVGNTFSSDFKRFFQSVPIGASAPAAITLQLNWSAALKR